MFQTLIPFKVTSKFPTNAIFLQLKNRTGSANENVGFLKC